MKEKFEKTNVMRLLDAAGIGYKTHTYTDSNAVSGLDVAEFLGQDPDRMFKTLVTVGRTGEHYVFVVPVSGELNLKKAASVSGEKSIEMIKQKELLPLTGYIHGGCSPIGMKKVYRTFVDETALCFDSIIFSAGKIGYQVELAPQDLTAVIHADFCDIT